MTSAEPPSKTEQPPIVPLPRRSRVKRIIVYTGLALVALGACYLGGWWMGRSEVGLLQAQVELERQRANTDLSQCAQQGAVLLRAARMLEARRQLDLAVAALDARNFGIAEQQVTKATRWLASAPAEGPAKELTKALEGYRLVATEDVGTQRKQLVDWISQLDPQIVIPAP